MHVYLATECKSVAMDTGDLPPRRTYQPAHMATLRSLPTLFFWSGGWTLGSSTKSDWLLFDDNDVDFIAPVTKARHFY